ncbi:haloacid dehalogenase type II [Arenicellales bacterium nBUS_45]|tara:strand:- start:287 stop:970 length:684 start_codon:yes stop_codon:yes gene_type:complete
MNQSALNGIKACVFDAYGTLFDVHSAVAQHTHQMANASIVSMLWRSKQLEYTWLRTLMGRYVDFWQVTGDALDFALDTHGISDSQLRADLMQAYLGLSCYLEVPEVLNELKSKDIRCAILSNGSPDMLSAAVNHAGLQAYFDAVLSVDGIQMYKPDPRVYQQAVDALGVDASEIAFQSSNAWDAAGADAFGFRVIWVNRFDQKAERLGTSVAAEINDLSSLTDLIVS